MAMLFFINPSRRRSGSRRADPVAGDWLPQQTVYSDFLLWTRRRQIPASSDFLFLVRLAMAL
jgi:hypothetical protein